MTPTPSFTQLGAAGQHGVGAFRRLDGENVAFHHHRGLSHVEAAERRDHAKARLEILPVFR